MGYKTDSNHGRIKILTDYELNGIIDHDIKIIPLILAESLPLHSRNVVKMNNFTDIYYNIMDIEHKTKTVRTDINHKISFPNAKTTVDTINAYCFSINPKCTSKEMETQQEIKDFNDCLNLDDSFGKLRKIAFFTGINGLGYRLVLNPSSNDIEEGKYIKSVGDLDPRDCFCVYSNNVEREKVLGVIFYDADKIVYGDNGEVSKVSVKRYNVMTKWHTWLFEEEGTKYTALIRNLPIGDSIIQMSAMPYSFSFDSNNVVVANEVDIPLIEYVRNEARTNDFELAISIMNAINRVVSDSLDAISQNVDYVFKMQNIDMGEFEEKTDKNGVVYLYNETLEKTKQWLQEHIIAFKGVEGSTIQPNVDILEVPLKLNEVESLLDFLKKELQIATFIPNREQGTGQDTGVAVENRNGFRSLEDVGGIVTNSMLSSEKEFYGVALKFAKKFKKNPFEKLQLKHITIDPLRNKMINIQETFNAVSTGLKANIPPELVFERANFVPDFIDAAKQYEDYQTIVAERKKAEANNPKQEETKQDTNTKEK